MNPTTIYLVAGETFDYSNPERCNFDIFDIAESLAKEPRFAGRTPGFYSVAWHSVAASYLVPEGYAFEALMHDAHEAFVKDIPAPMKRLLPDYRRLEERVARALRAHYGFAPWLSPAVKLVDAELLGLELAAFFDHRRVRLPAGDFRGAEHFGDLVELGWRDARDAFLGRYRELSPYEADLHFALDALDCAVPPKPEDAKQDREDLGRVDRRQRRDVRDPGDL